MLPFHYLIKFDLVNEVYKIYESIKGTNELLKLFTLADAINILIKSFITLAPFFMTLYAFFFAISSNDLCAVYSPSNVVLLLITLLKIFAIKLQQNVVLRQLKTASTLYHTGDYHQRGTSSSN